MRPTVGRAVALLLVVLGALVPAAAQSVPGEFLSGSVTIEGDVKTPMEYTVFLEYADSESASGYRLREATFHQDISYMPAGDYRVRFDLHMMDGLRVYWVDGDSDGSTLRADGTVVTLGGPTSLPAFDLLVHPMAQLSGRVTDEQGNGVSDIAVEINRLSVVSNVHRVRTDEQGYYDLGYVRPGDRRVEAVGRGDLAGAGTNLSVPASGSLTADLTLPSPSGQVAGTVVDSVTAEPLSYAWVEIFLLPHRIAYGSARADADGRFAFTGLRTGDYQLTVSDELSAWGDDRGGKQPVSIVAGETTTQDLPVEAVVLSWPYTAAGTVTDEQGKPLVGMKVVFDKLPGGEWDFTYTDRAGHWQQQLPDGDYRVRVEPRSLWYEVRPDQALWSPEYYPDALTPVGATTVTVSGQQPVEGLDMTLGLGALMPLDLRGPDGEPVSEAGYQLFDATTGEQVDHVWLGSVPSNPLVLRVPAGSWKLLLSGGSGQNGLLVRQWNGGAPSFASAPTITLTPGEVRPISTLTLPGDLAATTAPRITGKPQPGRTLRVTKGRWNLMTGTAFDFEWHRAGTYVSSGQKYVVRRADRGTTLTVYVMVTNEGKSAIRRLKIRVP